MSEAALREPMPCDYLKIEIIDEESNCKDNNDVTSERVSLILFHLFYFY